MRDFRSKGSQTIRATPDYFVPRDRKLGQRDLLVSTTMDQDFPRIETHCSLFFLSFYLEHLVERRG